VTFAKTKHYVADLSHMVVVIKPSRDSGGFSGMRRKSEGTAGLVLFWFSHHLMVSAFNLVS